MFIETFVSEIIGFQLLWNGPSFLSAANLNLSSLTNVSQFQSANPPEERKVKPVLHVVQGNIWNPYFTKFSSFSKLQQVIAYLLRFINNSKPCSEKHKGSLTCSELKVSLHFIVKSIQGDHFRSEIEQLKSQQDFTNKHIRKLTPFLDNTHLLRVGGGLSQSDFSFDQIHPLLLPSNNKLEIQMLSQEHIRLGHAGPQNNSV